MLSVSATLIASPHARFDPIGLVLTIHAREGLGLLGSPDPPPRFSGDPPGYFGFSKT